MPTLDPRALETRLKAGKLDRVHVFVGDDYWNLPFLTSRDPYSILFRRAAVSPRSNRPLGLLVFDADPHGACRCSAIDAS